MAHPMRYFTPRITKIILGGLVALLVIGEGWLFKAWWVASKNSKILAKEVCVVKLEALRYKYGLSHAGLIAKDPCIGVEALVSQTMRGVNVKRQ